MKREFEMGPHPIRELRDQAKPLHDRFSHLWSKHQDSGITRDEMVEFVEKLKLLKSMQSNSHVQAAKADFSMELDVPEPVEETRHLERAESHLRSKQAQTKAELDAIRRHALAQDELQAKLSDIEQAKRQTLSSIMEERARLTKDLETGGARLAEADDELKRIQQSQARRTEHIRELESVVRRYSRLMNVNEVEIVRSALAGQ